MQSLRVTRVSAHMIARGCAVGGVSCAVAFGAPPHACMQGICGHVPNTGQGIWSRSLCAMRAAHSNVCNICHLWFVSAGLHAPWLRCMSSCISCMQCTQVQCMQLCICVYVSCVVCRVSCVVCRVSCVVCAGCVMFIIHVLISMHDSDGIPLRLCWMMR